MRLFKYKCPKAASCAFAWTGEEGDNKGCIYCGMTYKGMETVFDRLEKVYHTIIPHRFRLAQIWYKIKCRYWKRYTTIKPRKLDHGWCDRDHLLIHAIFEVACQFLEKEVAMTANEWEWQREHNPEFYASWEEMRKLRDWWLYDYDEDYPYSLSDYALKQLEKDTGKSSYDIEQEYRASVREKCKRIIDISPWFWS